MLEAIQRPFAVYFNKNVIFAHGEASYRQGDRRQQTVPSVHLKIRKQNSLLFNADSTIFSPPAAAVFIFLAISARQLSQHLSDRFSRKFQD